MIFWLNHGKTNHPAFSSWEVSSTLHDRSHSRIPNLPGLPIETLTWAEPLIRLRTPKDNYKNATIPVPTKGCQRLNLKLAYSVRTQEPPNPI